jgi:4-aminobutyrate aminotransferase
MLLGENNMTIPNIITPLPGPKARRWLKVDETYVSPSQTRVYPLVAERAEGCWVWDVDGNCFLDFTAGVAVNATGHCHPSVTAAIEEQSKKLMHFCAADFYYPQYAQLAKRLSDLTPGAGAKKVFLGNSGAEAIEAAMKLARYHTRRPYFLAFYGAFHGRTFGALSLNASKPVQREGFAPLLPHVVHAPYGDLDFITDVLFKRNLPPQEVAAIFVEAIQGEGGYIVPPDEFLIGLRELCDEHGILLVDDEVQAGMGRTGKMWAMEHSGVVPDVICFAKGVASGLPLGGIIAKADLMTWGAGSHASTFGGNPVSCAAALATIDLLENGLMENAARVGEFIMARLRRIGHPLICDVRGRGLMIGIELSHDGEPATQERDAIIQKAFERGLLLLPCGANVVRFCPPLILTEEEASMGLEILEDILRE